MVGKIYQRKSYQKNIQDTSQAKLNDSSSSIILQDLHGFSKRRSEMTKFNA